MRNKTNHTPLTRGSRLADAKPPKCFEGLPITLVSAAIVSLSFMGFGGVIEHIFGA